MRVHLLVGVTCVLVACQESAPGTIPVDAAVDVAAVDRPAPALDVAASRDVPRDVPVALPDTPDVPPVPDVPPALDVPPAPLPEGCVRSLSGPAPREVNARGYGTFVRESVDGTAPTVLGPGVFDVVLRFPRGRVAGAPFEVDYRAGWPVPGWSTVTATLAADLSAEVTAPELSYPSFTLRLPGPDGAPEGTVTINAASGTDIVQPARAAMRFCVGDDLPLATLTPSAVAGPDGAPVAPDDEVAVLASAALSADAPASAHLRADGVDVATRVLVTASGLRIHPLRGLPPGARVTVGEVVAADRGGRAVIDASLAFTVLATSAVVVDRGFATEPPPGAVATNAGEVAVRDGALTLSRGALFPSEAPYPYSLLVALGDVGAARSVTVSATHGSFAARYRLVNAAGDVVDALWSGAGATRLTATLPRGGAWWLSVTEPARQSPTDLSPVHLPPLVIDDITLE